MADELEKQNPVNTVIVGYWLPTIRAAIEMNHNDPAKAIELLHAATSYELGQSPPHARVGRTSLSCLCARTGIPASSPGQRSRSGVSEIPRPSRHCRELPVRRTRPSRSRPRLRSARRHRQSQGGLSGFSHALERCRPRHSYPHRGESRVRKAEVTTSLGGHSEPIATQSPAPSATPKLTAATVVDSTVLTNKDILDMQKIGLPPEILVAKIKSSQCNFDTSPSSFSN